jgi:hypothetical protein
MGVFLGDNMGHFRMTWGRGGGAGGDARKDNENLKDNKKTLIRMLR